MYGYMSDLCVLYVQMPEVKLRSLPQLLFIVFFFFFLKTAFTFKDNSYQVSAELARLPGFEPHLSSSVHFPRAGITSIYQHTQITTPHLDYHTHPDYHTTPRLSRYFRLAGHTRLPILTHQIIPPHPDC